jgi:hypothetical protein
VAALEVNTTEAPVQYELLPEISGTAGNGFTVTVTEALVEQPVAVFVPVSVYVPELVTSMNDAVDPPGVHE